MKKSNSIFLKSNRAHQLTAVVVGALAVFTSIPAGAESIPVAPKAKCSMVTNGKTVVKDGELGSATCGGQPVAPVKSAPLKEAHPNDYSASPVKPGASVAATPPKAREEMQIRQEGDQKWVKGRVLILVKEGTTQTEILTALTNKMGLVGVRLRPFGAPGSFIVLLGPKEDEKKVMMRLKLESFVSNAELDGIAETQIQEVPSPVQKGAK